jgi:hypothetical protein
MPPEPVAEPTASDGRCLIIVPRNRLARFERLTARFAGDGRVQVRLDARGADRAADGVDLFAVGGGPLSPILEAWVEAQIRALEPDA